MDTATVANSNSYMPQNIADATIQLAIVKARKSLLIEYAKEYFGACRYYGCKKEACKN